jgi:cellulose synthase/poly-beta-1,6-N-acetylglucosamine synthase-like glycosyltransferase
LEGQWAHGPLLSWLQHAAERPGGFQSCIYIYYFLIYYNIYILLLLLLLLLIIIIIYYYYVYIYICILYIYMAQQNPSFEATAKCLPNAMGCNVRRLKHLLAVYLD